MRRLLAIALLLASTSCKPEDAPAEAIAEAAEEVVDPVEATPLARGKYAPQDECGEIEGASAFRDRFAAAVRARDTDALVTLAAADIMLDFGGGEGAGELRKRLEDPDGALWQELGKLTALGCAANDEGGVTIPWIAAQDLGDTDPFETLLVTGENVPVRETPDPAGKQVGSVSWDLVEVPDFQLDKPFQQVAYGDGPKGYIETGKLRTLTDYRLSASSRNGKWSITSLVAGD
jgi:hypothetical protein